MEEILDNYTRFYNKVKRFEDMQNFPQVADYCVSKDEVHEYFLEKQEILDKKGSMRFQYTIMGLLLILPIIISSAFKKENLPLGDYTFIISLLLGVILLIIYRVIINILIKKKLYLIYQENIEQYVRDVLNYNS